MEKMTISILGFVVLKVKSYQGPAAVLIVLVLVKIVESLKI